MNLCIIPARGGSKGVPRKNILKIAGKPLIGYTIESALESKMIDCVLVTSDDQEILTYATQYPGVSIHNRSSQLAGDESPIEDTIKEILNDSRYAQFTRIVLLQPTAPIRNGFQVDEAFKLFDETVEAKTLISVCKMEDVHPARMYYFEHDKLLVPILSEYERFRRQDLPCVYYRNGSIYICSTSEFLKTGKIVMSPSVAYEMPYSQLLNIDDKRDILIAEPLIRAWKEGQL